MPRSGTLSAALGTPFFRCGAIRTFTPIAATRTVETARRGQWGTSQARVYKNKLKQCMEALARGQAPYRDLGAIHPGLRSMLCQHHYIFGLTSRKTPFVVLAVLHERMDIITRLSSRPCKSRFRAQIS